MCNCGKKRTQIARETTGINRNIQSAIQKPVFNTGTILFQYTGNTALSVTGKVTRKNYRFNFPGNIVPVDFADAAAMMAVPVLKRV